MKRKPGISAEESEQFRDAIGQVASLRRPDRQPPYKPRPSTRARQTEKDEQAVMDHLLDHPVDPAMLESGETHEYRRNGVQHAVIRKLRRGQYACRAELDLHGLTAAEARQSLKTFLQEAHGRGLGCVRVIHGKGLRSTGRGPVLKPRVAAWLRQRADVLAFCTARPVDGGSGATYVLLRRG